MIPLGQRLNGIINSIVSWAPSLTIIKNVLDEADKHKEYLNVGSEFKTNKAEIKFQNVSFSYLFTSGACFSTFLTSNSNSRRRNLPREDPICLET